MTRRWMQSVDVEVDAQGRPVFEAALAAVANPRIVAAGTAAVGDTSPGQPARITETATACRWVLLMAPTAKTRLNADTVFAAVQPDSSEELTHDQVVAGGASLDPADWEGRMVPAGDLAALRLAGFDADDAVRYWAIG